MRIDVLPAPEPDRPAVSRCLLVEDEPDVVHILKRHLERRGFVVTVAPDLAAARDEVAVSDWGLVVLDVLLPDGDGRELIPALRRSDHPPAVILTSVLNRSDLAPSDADAFLDKPFREADVHKALAAVGL